MARTSMAAAVLLCAVALCVEGSVMVRIAQGTTNPLYNPYPAYNNPGVWSSDISPSTRYEAAAWRDTMDPEIIHILEGAEFVGGGPLGGFQTDHWIFNTTSLQWKCLIPGQTPGLPIQPPIIIGARDGARGISIPAFPGMGYIYGGQYNPLNGSPPNTIDDRWAYNATSGTWTQWSGYYGARIVPPDNTQCYTSQYDANPGIMGHHCAWTRLADNSGWLWGISQEMWAFYPSSDPTVSPFCFRRVASWPSGGSPPLYVESGLGPEARCYSSAVVDNVDSELVWSYGGQVSGVGVSELWRFNMTSTQWAFYGSSPSEFGTLGVSDLTNWPPGLQGLTAGMVDASIAPHVMYIYGGGGYNWNIVWSVYLGGSGHPQWARLVGDDSPNVIPDHIGAVGDGFVSGSIPPSRAYPETTLHYAPSAPYILQSLTGILTVNTPFVLEISLLEPIWMTHPSDVMAGVPISPAPVVNFNVYPVEFTLPVNGISAELFFEGAPASLDNVPVLLSGNLAPIVNSVATFPNLRVFGGATGLRFGLKIMNRVYNVFSEYFNSSCSSGCVAGYCANNGLAYPGVCRRCDEAAGYLLNVNYTTCTNYCPVGNYKNGPTNSKSCQPCGQGCAACVGTDAAHLSCTQCDEANGYTRSSSTGACVTECQVGEYNNLAATPHVCTACQPACSSCTDATNICTCNVVAGFAKDVATNQCVSPCLAGQAAQNGMCAGVTCTLPDTVNSTLCPSIAAYGTSCTVSCLDGHIGRSTQATCGQSGFNGAGAYSSLPGCVVCAPGSYARSGDEQCTKCLFSTTAVAAASSIADCVCSPTYYEADPATPGVCSECPTGAICAGGHAPPISAPGYFASGKVFIACAPASSCNGNNSCAEGYEGYVCGQCSTQYYRQGGVCHQCESTAGLKIAAGVIVGALLCLLLVFMARPHEVGNPGFAFATPSVLISFVQITATFLSVKLSWSDNLLRMFVAFSSINLNIDLVNPECVTTFSPYDKLRVALLVPVVILAVFVVAFAIYTAVNWFRAHDRQEALRRSTASAHMFGAGFLLFINLSYIFMAQTTLSFFSCRAFADGNSVLAEAPTTPCYDDAWYASLPSALFGIVFYVVLVPFCAPSVYLYLMRRHGNVVANAHPLINFSVSKYSSKLWWYDVLMIIRKLLVVSISTFVITDPVMSAVLCAIVLFLALLVGVILKPFAWDKHNIADGLATFTSLIILFFGILSTTQTSTAAQRSLLGNLAIVLVAFSLVPLVLIFFVEVFARYRIYQRERKDYSIVGHWRGQDQRVIGLMVIGEELISAEATTLKRWKAAPSATTYTDPDMTATVSSPVVGIAAADSLRFVVATIDGIELWDAVSFMRIASNDSVTGLTPVTKFVMSENTWMATAHVDSTVAIWSKPISGDVSIRRLSTTSFDSAVTCLSVVPGAIFVGLASGHVVRYDVDVDGGVYQNGRWRVRQSSGVESIAVLTERHLLLLAARFVVQGIDMKNGAAVGNLPGHVGEACYVNIFQDLIVTGTWTGVIRLWNADNGRFVARYTADNMGAIRTVCLRGDKLYAAGQDGSIFAWHIRPSIAVTDLDPFKKYWQEFKKRRRGGFGPALVEIEMATDAYDDLSAPHRSLRRGVDGTLTGAGDNAFQGGAGTESMTPKESDSSDDQSGHMQLHGGGIGLSDMVAQMGMRDVMERLVTVDELAAFGPALGAPEGGGNNNDGGVRVGMAYVTPASPAGSNPTPFL